MNLAPVFVDTWGWMALGYRREPRHDKVQAFYRKLRAQQIPIYTSDYVLDELITLLFRRESFTDSVRFVDGLFAATAQGHLVMERVTSERFATAWELRKQFQDKPGISFTDLTSMAIMGDLGISHVLTEDAHFVQVGMGFFRAP
ncbi:MAG: type II toxin-antitoxin system VapC family toxin [Anaerolineales bacterium]